MGNYTPEQVEQLSNVLPDEYASQAVALDAFAATLRQQAGVDEGMVAAEVRCILTEAERMGYTVDTAIALDTLRAVLAALAQNTQGEDKGGVWQYRVKGSHAWRDAEGPINSDYNREEWEVRRVYLHAERARVPELPPEAVPVGEGTLLPGAGTKDWAIHVSFCCTRVVDERMAYGWNECRKAMQELLAAAPSQRAEVK